MSNLFIFVLVAAVAFLAVLVINYYRMKNKPEPKNSPKIVQITNKNISNFTRKGVTILDFWATWCAPCKYMTPILNEIAESETLDVRVGKINVDQQKMLARKRKVGSVPTMIIYKDGMEVSRIVGVKSRRVVMRELKNVMN